MIETLKRPGRVLGAVILVIFAIQVGACSSDADKPLGKAATELSVLLDSNPELEAMLAASIDKAQQANPDPNSNPVQSVDDYLSFITWAETAMPWSVLYQKDPPDIYSDTFQSLVYSHFLIDQPLPELEGKGLVNNSLQYYEPFASWFVAFSESWGDYLDTEASWNEDYLRMAQENPAYGLQNGWYEDPSNWTTFNEFFSRYLKSTDQRPVAAPDDDSVVASFADSTPQGVWAIDANSELVDESGTAVKSATIRSIRALLGDDSEYGDAFAGGSLTHSFLNVNDYHRYHFPMGGTVLEARVVPGINPSGGMMWWDAENGRYAFDPGTRLGWQSLETRGVVIVDTGDYGLVALLPIGMSVVSSVNLEDNVMPGAVIEKGDMLGHFAFGGSDFVMLFQDGVEFSLDVSTGEEGYEHVLTGERLGSLTKTGEPR